MATSNSSQWKMEQRELLRAAFAPAFTRYAELVHKNEDPEDFRKYLTFIAAQVGLEEPVFKANAHDGLTTVNINIGMFNRIAAPLGAIPPRVRPALAPSDVVEVLEVGPPQAVQDVEVLEMPPATPVPPEEYDFESVLDDLVSKV